ncbi:hypothetical protein [Streptomyces triticiradicis]|uniref:Uncharacterized protein n=1 Tax=Streptomyces triticiradicis TaxID=2651189 RepID=A0A7J5D6K4_9ACTN|nr:hypothetical protein [Streptomyces triticiradicis]KAB1980181.1 hypothetical protein F8144_34035 [Streptomyces triticiradicis]
MIPDWLTTLAAAGSAALVGAASTDAWQTARDRFARLLGRGDAEHTRTAVRHLDELRSLAQRPGSRQELAEARRTWRLHLQNLLAEHPDAADELRSAIAELPPPGPASAAAPRQENRAYDHGTVNAVVNGNLTIHQTGPDASRS